MTDLASASHLGAGIGAALMLSKTLIIVIGLQLIRHAGVVETGSCHIRIAGIGLAMVIGPIAEVIAYSFAPLSLLAPINGFDVVWNILLAPCTLGEENNCATKACTLIVFIGSSLAPLVGPHVTESFDLEEMRENFISVRFLVYCLVSTAALAIGVAVLKRRKLRRILGERDIVRGTLIGVGGGAVAGQTYFLSTAATLVRSSINDGNWTAWSDVLPWVILGGAIACALLNAVLMNKGLAEFEATFFVPMFAGSAVVAACLSGAVVLRETRSLPTWRLLLYWSGVSLIVGGLGVLARAAFQKHHLSKSFLLTDGGSSDQTESGSSSMNVCSDSGSEG